MALIPWGLVLLFQMVIHPSRGNYLHSGVALSLFLAELVLSLLVLEFVGNVKKGKKKTHTKIPLSCNNLCKSYYCCWFCYFCR